VTSNETGPPGPDGDVKVRAVCGAATRTPLTLSPFHSTITAVVSTPKLAPLNVTEAPPAVPVDNATKPPNVVSLTLSSSEMDTDDTDGGRYLPTQDTTATVQPRVADVKTAR
jgi:hypothetical protein